MLATGEGSEWAVAASDSNGVGCRAAAVVDEEVMAFLGDQAGRLRTGLVEHEDSQNEQRVMED